MPDQDVIRKEQDYYLDEEPYEPVDEDEDLTHEPRKRRSVGRLTVGLAALLIAGLGFLGGVLVQKQQADDSPAAGAGGPQAAGGPTAAGSGASGGQRPGGQPRGRGRAGGAGGGQAPTTGEVKSKSGNVLYIEGADGNTVKVTLNGQSEVTRTATSSAKRIHPGDTVVVQGAKAKNGQVKATSVSATAAGAGGGGLPAMFGGGMPGGAMPSGAPGGGGAGGGQGLPAMPAPPGGG